MAILHNSTAKLLHIVYPKKTISMLILSASNKQVMCNKLVLHRYALYIIGSLFISAHWILDCILLFNSSASSKLQTISINAVCKGNFSTWLKVPYLSPERLL